ncbi:glutamine--tRNA ligase/YqeY domain fusion protein [Opitutales bacterium]|nr:glutamine--tRNA ligase/YqeY domain fusion protein [Opitutales bacterium]MDA8991509.1 glutamine--tRNA ligase/YqeY domain fusion protein [Opitutales bacterium]
MEEKELGKSLDFIRTIISEDVTSQKNDGRVHTRFPPEPNGYLHLGHAKSICLNFGIAEEFNGLCNLRLDDTNPSAEKAEYALAIQGDLRWLGFDWEDRLFHASDNFQQLYEWAIQLIKDHKAYVCDLTFEEMREYRGTLTEPGKNSPYRNREVSENIDLLERMKKGEFEEGTKTLRVKIDMNSPNLNMRDPVIYRIMHREHPETGDKWKIYPSYDFAHGQSDSLEGITHSLCTLEFEHHRPLYDWFCKNLGIHHPQQIEFARLNLNYTVMSKRKMLRLVEEGHVDGWDDPRMATLSGMRRRGFTPSSIRSFCDKVGLAKRENIIEMELLEFCLREDLNKSAHRRLGVLDPLKVTISNYPESKVEELDAINNPEDPTTGTRKVSFSREVFIDRNDFMEDPPKKYFRMAVGKEVRLKYAYYITCQKVIKDEDGKIIELICEYDPESRGGGTPDQRKVKGTIQWVDSTTAINPEIRLYDRLFKVPNPDEVEEGKDFLSNLNSDSLTSLSDALVEKSIEELQAGEPFQLERIGYFTLDTKAQEMGKLVLNRSVAMRDSWAKKHSK